MRCTELCQTSKVINLVTKGRAILLQESLRLGECCKACCNRNKDTLLIIGVKNGHLNVVQSLLAFFGDEYTEFYNKTGKRALHEAAQCNQIDIARFLLKQGASTVDALKQGDWTPFMLATGKRNLEMIRLLVGAGADTRLVNKDGWNGFHIAARAGRVEVLEYLHKIDNQLICTVSKNGRTPLHSAALNNCINVTEWILSRGISANVTDSAGLTPLMDGARMGNVAVCDVLISQGADVLQLDCCQRTVLHHVTQAGQLDMIIWCVAKVEQNHKQTDQPKMKPDIRRPSHFLNWQSGQGSTALHYASKEGRISEIELLLKLGADKNIPDKLGRLPVDLSRNENVKQVFYFEGKAAISHAKEFDY